MCRKPGRSRWGGEEQDKAVKAVKAVMNVKGVKKGRLPTS